jgi:uncharacterized protein YndB with AHSA1/START domain
MPQHDDLAEDLTVERDTELGLDVEELWALISTAEGWTSWFVERADLTIAPDAEGVVVDDDVERRVHVDSVVEGRRIAFSWWETDDPWSVSHVQFDIVELPAGRSRLHVTERFVGTPATAPMSCSVGVSWDVRLVSLWLMAVQSHVMA